MSYYFCPREWTHMQTHVCAHTHIHAHTHTHAHMHVHTRTHMHTCAYTHTHAQHTYYRFLNHSTILSITTGIVQFCYYHPKVKETHLSTYYKPI